MWLLALVRLALGLLALRGVRWAYVAFVALGLLYFPAKVGFRLAPRPCRLAFDLPLAIHSLTNYAHVVLFALFFVMTGAQFRVLDRSAFAWSAAATVAMGALVEAAQGVTGEGNCRLRDLIPDGAGILVGSVIVLFLKRVDWRPRPPTSSATTSRSSWSCCRAGRRRRTGGDSSPPCAASGPSPDLTAGSRRRRLFDGLSALSAPPHLHERVRHRARGLRARRREDQRG